MYTPPVSKLDTSSFSALDLKLPEPFPVYCDEALTFYSDTEILLETGPEQMKRKASDDLEIESSWRPWTKLEEIFLVGAVFDLILERGSLTSSNNRTDVWVTVKAKFDAVREGYLSYREAKRCRAYCTLSRRTSASLNRHYKILKERVSGKTKRSTTEEKDVFSFSAYFSAYETLKQRIGMTDRLTDKATEDRLLAGFL